jgi:hypothetical protein
LLRLSAGTLRCLALVLPDEGAADIDSWRKATASGLGDAGGCIRLRQARTVADEMRRPGALGLHLAELSTYGGIESSESAQSNRKRLPWPWLSSDFGTEWNLHDEFRTQCKVSCMHLSASGV